jgi:DNA-binding XRE family transcriptional regulator
MIATLRHDCKANASSGVRLTEQVVCRRAPEHTARIVKQETFQIGFGKRVVAYRKARSMTQEQLADGASMTRNSLSDIELGKTNVSLNTARRLATVLKCTVAELMPDYSPE